MRFTFRSLSCPLPTFAGALSLALGLSFGLTASPASALTTIQKAEVSAQLYQYGRDEADPLAIISAARIRKSLGFQPGGPAPDQDGTEEARAAEPLTWQAMLDTARELATGDDYLTALIDDIEAEATKGVATGQVYSISTIRDGGTDTYDPLPFKAGEYAEVYVESRDGSDLNLFVNDSKGRLVCSDTDISAISYCGWRPGDAGNFTIVVKNRGRGPAGYSLMTN